MNPQKILDFWFEEIDPSYWFMKDDLFDQKIRDRFMETYKFVVNEGFTWRLSPSGRLAEIIVLDQFPRNMFRDKPEAFVSDHLALLAAQEAVQVGADLYLPVSQRSFIYMPYMHSENPQAHEEAVRLFSTPGLEYNLKYELAHKAIIDRFGRYPHRNKVLGRQSTPEEEEFLKMPGSSF